MAQFASFDVPAGNGSGVALSAPENVPRTIVVSGAFLGLVVIEGSLDGATGWNPLVTFQKTDFREIGIPYPFLRVTRQGVPAVGAPGLPSVSIGCCVVPVFSEILAPPAGVGPGAATSIVGLSVEAVSVIGTLPLGTVVNVEISVDGTNWVTLAPSCSRACAMPVHAIAAQARMNVQGNPGTLPQVALLGTSENTRTVVLTPPVLNGAGAAVDTSVMSALKSILFTSATGDVPGRMLVQGSNDGGVTWCDVISTNVVGLRTINGVFQFMRLVVAGLTTPVALTVGVGALECLCSAPTEGESFTDVSIGGV